MAAEIITYLFHFPQLYFISIPTWWLRFLRRTVIYIDNQLAVRLMCQLWITPLFQDRSLIGRLLSFTYRTSRIIIGSLLLVLTIFSFIVWLAVWVTTPIFLQYYFPYFWVIFVIVSLLDSLSLVLLHLTDLTRKLLRINPDSAMLLKALLKLPEIKHLLWLIEKPQPPQDKLPRLFDIVNQAQILVKQTLDTHLQPIHLLLSYLKLINYHATDAISAYLWTKQKLKWSRTCWLWDDAYPIRPIGGVNRGWTGLITPTLNLYSFDLTDQAAKSKLTELVGHELEITEIVRILGRYGRENVLIIGDPGSGKTTLVHGLANEIVRGTPFAGLKFKRLVDLDIGSLTTGTHAEITNRLKTIIEEIEAAGNVILFIDEIHNLLNSEIEKNLSALFTLLEPHLDSGKIQFLATSDPLNYKRWLDPYAAFVRTFRQVNLAPATTSQTQTILLRKAYELEQSQKVSVTWQAIGAAVELARRYIPDRVLPDAAIDLLEETCNSQALTTLNVATKEVSAMVTEKTGIPVTMPDSQQEKEKLLQLEKYLHQRVIGQDEAINSLAAAMRRARTGLSEANRVLASFLFAGPTGVGKTETAKTLAQILFSNEQALVRLDMSEYQTPESLNRLLGPPPGAPDFGMGGQLTEAVRHKPFSVVLLDEIEKAAPNILDVFLQVLDDARLTDGSGRTIDFSNTIIIATSNIGTRSLLDQVHLGISFSEIKVTVFEELRKHFRPEFLNRFTDIVVFQPLNATDIAQITQLLLKSVENKLAEKEIRIDFAADLVSWISQTGFSSDWGARELKRVIFHEVEEKLAKMLLAGTMIPNHTYHLTREFLEQE